MLITHGALDDVVPRRDTDASAAELRALGASPGLWWTLSGTPAMLRFQRSSGSTWRRWFGSSPSDAVRAPAPTAGRTVPTVVN